MDLVQIRYFLALARTLNFTRAAEQCNVTQPALTKSIQRLEDELGGPLLLRERALTQLTELGRGMLPLLEQTFAAAERAKAHATGMQRQATWPLRVGVDPAAPLEPFLPLFAEVARSLPGLQLTLVETTGAALVDSLLHGRLDLALLLGEADLVERLNRWRLFRDRLVVVLPADDALAQQGSVAASALADRPVIGWMAQGGNGGSNDGEGDKGGMGAVGLPSPRHHAASAGGAMHLVCAGLGVAVMAGRAARHPALACRPLEPAVEHEVVLAAVAGRPFGRAADGFVKLARARGWDAG